MSELTREQVESLLPLVSFDAQSILLAGTGDVGVYSALAIMIDTDAALRTRIAALEAALSQVDTIGAHVNAECENGCGTKFRALLQYALAAPYQEKEATS